MKTRKQVRLLYKALYVESGKTLAHACKFFKLTIHGECTLCMLIRHRKIFAAIHLAREHNIHPEWFEAERTLYDLLGEKAFFNKIEIELTEVANYPRKECPSCGEIVTFFIPFKKLVKSKKRNIRQTHCNYCGHIVDLVELPTLPFSKENNKTKDNDAPRLKPRSRPSPLIVNEPLTIETVGAEIIRKQESIAHIGAEKLKALIQQIVDINHRELVQEILNGNIPGNISLNSAEEIVVEQTSGRPRRGRSMISSGALGGGGGGGPSE